MARPCLEKSQRREIRLSFRVSPEDEIVMRLRAKQAGLSFPDYARSRLIAGAVEIAPTSVLPPVLTLALYRISVNFGQLLRNIDAEGVATSVEQMRERLRPLFWSGLNEQTRQTAADTDGEATRLIKIRLTADQRDVISARADQVAMSVSAFAREMLTEGRIRHAVYLASDPALATALNKLGRKINKKTEHANATGRIPSGIPECIEELDTLLQRLPEIIP